MQILNQQIGSSWQTRDRSSNRRLCFGFDSASLTTGTALAAIRLSCVGMYWYGRFGHVQSLYFEASLRCFECFILFPQRAIVSQIPQRKKALGTEKQLRTDLDPNQLQYDRPN